MLIFKEDSRTGVSCGLNDFGELFIGNSRSGYNLPDTSENREKIPLSARCRTRTASTGMWRSLSSGRLLTVLFILA